MVVIVTFAGAWVSPAWMSDFFIEFDLSCSLGLNEDVIVVRGDSPVLAVVVFIGIVLLVVSKEGVELQALLEVLGSLKAANVFEHVVNFQFPTVLH